MKWTIDRYDRYFGKVNKGLSESERQVLLKEYEICTSSIESQRDILFKVSNLLIAIFSIASSIIIFITKEKTISIPQIYGGFALIGITTFSLALILYFTEQNKRIFYNSLKLIIIRRVLGLNFDYFNPIVPRNIIEGARNPFDIKMFQGWLSLQVLPLVFIVVISGIGFFNVLYFVKYLENSQKLIIFAPFIFVLSNLVLVRKFSLDHYENLDLVFFQFTFNKILRIKLEENFGWPLYRAWMNVNEAKRLKIDLNKFKPILIYVEDKNFNKHKGISYKAMSRAIYNRFMCPRKMKSGGSTITQQLFRSLFIIEYNKKVRRKLAELIFSRLWLEKLYEKDEILDLYLCSVRYERNVIGVLEAIKYFFPNEKNKELSTAEMFFLIERVANSRSIFLKDRVTVLVSGLAKENIITFQDALTIVDVYKKMIQVGKVKCDKNINEWEVSMKKSFTSS